MDKKSHLKIASIVADSVFPFANVFSRLAFLYGSLEPDLNVFTYIKGHGEGRVKGYIVKTLKELENKRFWSFSDYYKAGRISHYIVDSFTYPHTSSFEGSMKKHIEWEKRLAKCLFSTSEIKVKRGIGFTLDDIKKRYRMEIPSIENDITYSISSLLVLIRKAYSPEFVLPFAVRKIFIR